MARLLPRRWLAAFLTGPLVAFALLWLMQWMVARGGGPAVSTTSGAAAIQFVRVKPADPPPELRRRPPPPPPPPSRPAAPAPAWSAPAQAALPLPQAPERPAFQMPLALEPALTGPVGPALEERDVLPLARVPPVYPPRALRQGAEGWVKLSFLVTATGEAREIVVLDADPRGMFEQAAMQAVARWTFKPRMTAGKAVAARVEQTVDFRLQKERP